MIRFIHLLADVRLNMLIAYKPVLFSSLKEAKGVRKEICMNGPDVALYLSPGYPSVAEYIWLLRKSRPESHWHRKGSKATTWTCQLTRLGTFPESEVLRVICKNTIKELALMSHDIWFIDEPITRTGFRHILLSEAQRQCYKNAAWAIEFSLILVIFASHSRKLDRQWAFAYTIYYGSNTIYGSKYLYTTYTLHGIIICGNVP